jgi:cobalt/nickel transport system permease protein
LSFIDASRLDRHAYLDSFVHRLDPRAKVLATLVFILSVVSFDRYALSGLLPFLAFPVCIAVLAFVPFGLIVRRLAVALPFILLVGIFNPLLDRTVMIEFGGLRISGGWVSFASILLRGLLCVSAAMVLIATTPVPRLAEALGALRLPRALVVQLLLLYRYLFVLADEAGRMRRARALRAAKFRTSPREAAGMLSVLLLRTVDRSEGIWRAMLARGFDGQIRSPKRISWDFSDIVFLVLVSTYSLGLRVLPVTDRLGEWVLMR